jgi:putative Ca2+/H+ antiporter (TMEM165/GDT1 family)
MLCTLAAVLGGKQLASLIDERTVAIIGGVVFLIFGALAMYEGPGV